MSPSASSRSSGPGLDAMVLAPKDCGGLKQGCVENGLSKSMCPRRTVPSQLRCGVPGGAGLVVEPPRAGGTRASWPPSPAAPCPPRTRPPAGMHEPPHSAERRWQLMHVHAPLSLSSSRQVPRPVEARYSIYAISSHATAAVALRSRRRPSHVDPGMLHIVHIDIGRLGT